MIDAFIHEAIARDLLQNRLHLRYVYNVYIMYESKGYL